MRAEDKKVAVVTGANRGIGYETCRQLAKADFRVILTARNPDKGVRSAKVLQDEDLDVTFCACDVTDPKSIQELKSFIESQYGRLDVLINNAGILPDNKTPGQFEDTSILETDLSTLSQAMNTNAFSVILLCRYLIPLMKKHSYGRIVNVSSQVAQLSAMDSGIPAYRLSKVALNAITVILADELKGTGILCNCMSPGWVKTEMGGPNASVTPQEGTRDIVWLATLPDDGPTGKFFRQGKQLDW
jgi:NAD(P)-dependent dehydrogenase (short-subunit alcohol dehydrogenase family)